MIPTRWTLGCVALVGFASGCSDAPDPEPRLYPVLNERGLITYTYQQPEAPVSSGGTWVRDPRLGAEAPRGTRAGTASESWPTCDRGRPSR